MGALADLTVKLFGVPTTNRARAVTVTSAAPFRLLDENPDRLAWTIQNRSANFGVIDFSRNPTTASGFRLNASIGAAAKDYRVDGESVGYELFALNDTADGTWYVEEILALPRPE